MTGGASALPGPDQSPSEAERDAIELRLAGLLMTATRQLLEVFDLLQLDANERTLLQGAAVNYGEALSGIRRLEWVRTLTTPRDAFINPGAPLQAQSDTGGTHD